jgi:hypothetical protein
VCRTTPVCRTTRTEARPSKLPASRSRRCRGRTCRSCRPPTRRGTQGTWMRSVSFTTPTASCARQKAGRSRGHSLAGRRSSPVAAGTRDLGHRCADTDQRLHRCWRPSCREADLAWDRAWP